MLALTACGPLSEKPAPNAPGSTAATPGSSATAPPATAENAESALASFSDVVVRVWASDERDRGRAYIDALEAAGFSKDRMQVTADRSTVDNPAESLQFSVAWSDTECLVGQVGPSTGEPVTAIMPRLADGACLVGKTRAIDW